MARNSQKGTTFSQELNNTRTSFTQLHSSFMMMMMLLILFMLPFCTIAVTLEIRDNHYKLGRILGQGAYGKVIEALEVETERMVAIKLILYPKENPDAVKEAAQMEVTAMQELNHPNIVQLYFHEENDDGMVLVMESCHNDLTHYFLFPAANEDIVKDLLMDIADGLKHIFDKRWTHGDLKPENLFLCGPKEHTVLKIGDFGHATRSGFSMASLFSAPAVPLDRGGSYDWYRAPELIYDEKSELWSVGIILYQFLHGMAHPIFRTIKVSEKERKNQFRHYFKHLESEKSTIVSLETLVNALIQRKCNRIDPDIFFHTIDQILGRTEQITPSETISLLSFQQKHYH